MDAKRLKAVLGLAKNVCDDTSQVEKHRVVRFVNGQVIARGITCALSAELCEFGFDATVEASLLQNNLRYLGESLEFTSTDNFLVLSDGSKRAKSRLSNAKIDIKQPETSFFCTVLAKDCQKALQIGSVSADNGKVEISAKNGIFNAVSTNGGTLARGLVECQGEIPKTILPIESTRAVIGVLGESDGDVKVSVGERAIVFECQGATIYSAIGVGSLPQWEKLASRRSGEKFEVNGAEFAKCVIFVASVVTEGTNCIEIYSDGSDRVQLRSGTHSQGDNSAEIDAYINECSMLIEPSRLGKYLQVAGDQEVYINEGQSCVFCKGNTSEFITMEVSREGGA